jgi:hypothetical protein
VQLSVILKSASSVEEDIAFDRWQRQDPAGRIPSPVALGVFCYIGRGWTFNDLEENTSIWEETHRQFFHLLFFWVPQKFTKNM